MVSHEMHPFDTIIPKMMFGSVLEHVGLNTLLRGTEVAKTVSPQKHPFYSIGLKVMFGGCLEHLQTFYK
jgi:hypothetical protein